MPALVTHYLHARGVYSRAAEYIECPSAFYLGAQGPDFTYFHRVLPFWFGRSLFAEGTLLHKIPADILFSAFSEYLAAHPDDDIAKSYAQGFLCHYSLDRHCHPYVYALEEKIKAAEGVKYFRGFVHSRIEHYIDVDMIKEVLGIPGNDFDYRDALTGDEQVVRSCAKITAYVINKFSNYEVRERQTYRAFFDTRALQIFSRDPHGIKHALTRGAERMIFFPPAISTFVRTADDDGKYDYLNRGGEEWVNPFDISMRSNKSFMQLVADASDESVRLIERFCRGGKVDFTGNFSMKTGLKISDGAKTDDTYTE